MQRFAYLQPQTPAAQQSPVAPKGP